MYALKIRKSDQAILTLLNDGVPVEIPKKTSYLIVTPGESAKVVTEREFDDNYAGRLSTVGPFLMKINKN